MVPWPMELPGTGLLQLDPRLSALLSALIRVKKLVPPGAAKVGEGLDVAFDDGVGVGVGGNGAFDAVFAQQVQRGMGRAVGVVGDVVRLAACELVLRMEARDLEHAFEAELGDQR